MHRFRNLSWAMGTLAIAALLGLATDAQVRSDFNNHFYTAGHGDIGVAYDETTNSFDLHYHFGGTAAISPPLAPGEVEASPGDVTTVIGNDAGVTRFASTSSIASAFGGTTGTLPEYWVLRQSSADSTRRPFLGIAAEDLDLSLNWSDSITFALVGVSGPGEFAVWSGNTSSILDLWMASADGIDPDVDYLSVSTGSHEHFNIGFSKTGVYDVTLRALGTLNGQAVTGEGTFRFNVVPEPSAFALMGLGLGGLLFARSFRRRESKDTAQA